MLKFTELPYEMGYMFNSTDISIYTENLSPDMQNAAQIMADQMDVFSPEGILSLGNETRSRMSSVSTELLDIAIDSDMAPALKQITKVAKQVSRFGSMLRSAKSLARPRAKARLMDSYDLLKVELLRVSGELERDRRNLIRSISLLEDTHRANLEIYQELGVIIEAGNIKLAALHTAPVGYEDHIHRLELKLSDLNTSRMVCRQTAVQIFLLRDSAYSLLDRINSISESVVPLWTTQVALALGVSSISESQLSATGAFNTIADATRTLSQEIASTTKCIAEAGKNAGQIRS